MNKKLYGYVTSKKFGKFLMPVPFQNIILNNYALKNSLLYYLPSTELVIRNCHLSLFSTIQKMEKKTNLGMCSILMMPMDKKKISYLFNQIERKNIQIHFIYEKKIIKNQNEFINEIKNYQLEKSTNDILEFL